MGAHLYSIVIVNNEICLGDTAVYTEADPSSVCCLLKYLIISKSSIYRPAGYAKKKKQMDTCFRGLPATPAPSIHLVLIFIYL